MLRGTLSVIMAIRPLRGAGSGVLGMSCGIPHTCSNHMDPLDQGLVLAEYLARQCSHQQGERWLV